MENSNDCSSVCYNIAIIGFGPKGLYGLERLLAQIGTIELELPVQIHVFNNNGFFGAGDVYRCDQPSYLIMNYANRNIGIWSNEIPKGVLENTPDFAKWLSNKSGVLASKLNDGFAPRAMVGSYLMEGFTELCQNSPENVSVIPHINMVKDIDRRSDGYILKTKNKEENLPKRFKKILLTTGHFWCGANFKSTLKTAPYIDFIYPTDKNLNGVAKGSKVAIKGLGLTYIDAVLALTEGRGGVFKSSSDGRYNYSSSGNEPKKIFPFSRTGIPMIPRSGAADDKTPPYFLTEESLRDSRFLAPVHFKNSILPLIKKEFLFNYYRVLFRDRNRELLYSTDFQAIQKQIHSFHEAFPTDTKFSWEAIENPFEATDAPSHEELLSYVRAMLSEAEKGPIHSPLSAAVGSWRKISTVFNKIYSFGGLDATSHQLFDSYYFGFFNRISYGPPIDNVKKILALADCGILDFSFARNPEVTFLKQTDVFRMQSNDKQKAISVDCLVDARIPKGNPNGKVSKLFSNLLERGTVRYFQNEDDKKYAPGCVDIDFKGRPLDSGGNINKDMTFYGTPTEGITFDNDTLSRKRNNFASQWAFDVTVDIKRAQENFRKRYDRENALLSR